MKLIVEFQSYARPVAIIQWCIQNDLYRYSSMGVQILAPKKWNMPLFMKYAYILHYYFASETMSLPFNPQ